MEVPSRKEVAILYNTYLQPLQWQHAYTLSGSACAEKMTAYFWSQFWTSGNRRQEHIAQER